MAPLSDDVRRALEGKNFWSLATLNPDGTPQNTIVWVDTRDDKIVINSIIGRKKPRNLERNPEVSLAWYDPASPYSNVSIQGRVVDTYTGERADADIDALAKKYLNQDAHEGRQEGERRVSYVIEPTHVWTRL
jgi:PPOX class probable F420-dependent enzyme